MLHLTKHSWDNLSAHVKAANPTLFSLLAEVAKKIEPENKYLIQARYSYGSLILSEGRLQCPCETADETCTDESCRSIKRALSYAKIPLGLVVSRNAEVFLQHSPDDDKESARIVSLRILSPGDMFGVFETADHMAQLNAPGNPMWNVSAGARSVTILLDLSDVDVRKGLANKLGITLPSIEQGEAWTKDNHEIVRFIDSKTDVDHRWYCDVLFLTENWLIGERPSNIELRDYILKRAWAQSQPLRDFDIVQLQLFKLWKTDGRQTGYQSKHLDHYVTLHHHLFLAQRGQRPVMSAVTEKSDANGPLWNCQQVLCNATQAHRRRTPYYPLVLEPVHLSHDQKFGICSLSKPNFAASVIDFSGGFAGLAERFAELESQLDPAKQPLALGNIHYFGTAKTKYENWSSGEGRDFKRPIDRIRDRYILDKSLLNAFINGQAITATQVSKHYDARRLKALRTAIDSVIPKHVKDFGRAMPLNPPKNGQREKLRTAPPAPLTAFAILSYVEE